MFFDKLSVSLNEVGVVPKSPITYSDSDVNLGVEIGNNRSNVVNLGMPIISAAMDSVFSMKVMDSVVSHGGLCILNLCGLISRYKLTEYPNIYQKVVNVNHENKRDCIKMLQDIYNSRHIDIDIMISNINIIKETIGDGGLLAVSATPQWASRLFDKIMACFPSINVFVVQSSFVSPYWKSVSSAGLDIIDYCKMLHKRNKILMVGNVASLDAAKDFIDNDVDAIIEGIGPGCQCTTRRVLGIGAGHVTALKEIREYISLSNKNTTLIADGGIHNSGDIVKLLSAGAHGVILGGMFARSVDSPFTGYHWGMSSFHKTLPRGTMLYFSIDENITVDKILDGPSFKDDGTLAVLPALSNALSNLGCTNINEMYYNTELVRFPGIGSEGKYREYIQ